MNWINKCFSEEIEEINQIETEASNESFVGLWKLPAKGLGAQGTEAAAEAAGAEWLAHLALGLDYIDLGLDIGKEWWEYNEFEKNLNKAKQRRCGCIQNAANQ
jgi:hypothetical protein